jgi:hypothetical protein
VPYSKDMHIVFVTKPYPGGKPRRKLHERKLDAQRLNKQVRAVIFNSFCIRIRLNRDLKIAFRETLEGLGVGCDGVRDELD